jgi:hypothetical protein
MKRKKAGRKPLPGGREKFTTTLPRYVKRHLMKEGNASEKIIGYVDRELADIEDRRGVNRLADIQTGDIQPRP